MLRSNRARQRQTTGRKNTGVQFVHEKLNKVEKVCFFSGLVIYSPVLLRHRRYQWYWPSFTIQLNDFSFAVCSFPDTTWTQHNSLPHTYWALKNSCECIFLNNKAGNYSLYYPKVYWLLKPRHLRVHLHINTRATCRVEVEFSSLAAFVPDDSQPGKKKNRHETKGTLAFETLCFSAASKDFSEREKHHEKEELPRFFFPPPAELLWLCSSWTLVPASSPTASELLFVCEKFSV